MSFGQNLQFFRKLHHGMTQEELAEKMGVSRQTISKWESDAAFPEMEKAIGLCNLFSCSLDGLVRENMNLDNAAYTQIRLEIVPAFVYVQYAVISTDPEGDAVAHMTTWAATQGLEKPNIIGWDFPMLSQEQISIYHMHGYTAACILPHEFQSAGCGMEQLSQADQSYAIITIEEPFRAPFSLIPNAYQTLLRYMEVNGLRHKQAKEVLPCFERVYQVSGTCFMDVYIAAEA